MSRALMRLRPSRRITSGVGPFEFLRPRRPNGDVIPLPIGMTFDNNDGELKGSAYDTTKATPVNTVTLTEQGSPLANFNLYKATLLSLSTTATANTVIKTPYPFVMQGGIGDSIELYDQTHSFWIITEPDDMSAMPTSCPGTARGSYVNRVTFADHLDLLPELQQVNSGNTPQIIALPGAHHYYFDGLFISNPLQKLQLGSMISMYNGNQPEDRPHDIIFDHLLVDGGDVYCTQRIWSLSGQNIGIIDSACRAVGYQESQAVGCFGNIAGVRIHNNDFRDMCGNANEVILTGGVPDTGMIYDLEITGNYLANRGQAKAGIEIKKGERVVIDGNEFGTNTSGNPQNGQIFIRCTEQSGTDVTTVTKDFVITNNKIPEGPGGIVIVGAAFSPVGVLDTYNGAVLNNLVYGMGLDGLGIPMRLWGNLINNIRIEYNTLIGSKVLTGGYIPAIRFEDSTTDPDDKAYEMQIQNNVLVASTVKPDWMISCADGPYAGYTNDNALSNILATGSETGGNLVSTLSNVASQIGCASIEDMGMVDYDTDQYELSPSSPGYAAGADGNPVGYQKPLFDFIQARVLPA